VRPRSGLFIPGFVVHHAHGEKMERVKMKRYVTKLQDIQVNRGDNEEIRYEATRYTSKFNQTKPHEIKAEIHSYLDTSHWLHATGSA
jgi:hypothetical protein